MTQLKFRVWIKAKVWDDMWEGSKASYSSRMLEVKTLHLSAQKVMIATKYGNHSFHYEAVELMQYTGMKDSKGTEIYAGDIVQRVTRSSGYIMTGIVEWIGTQWSIHTANKWSFSWADPEYKPVEVIGNIWENPELILY